LQDPPGLAISQVYKEGICNQFPKVSSLQYRFYYNLVVVLIIAEATSRNTKDIFARAAKLSTSSIAGIRLNAAGLVALADIKTIAQSTALTGSASFLDILLIAPGIHCQQGLSEVNNGGLRIPNNLAH
jgi:hypothetical protein